MGAFGMIASLKYACVATLCLAVHVHVSATIEEGTFIQENVPQAQFSEIEPLTNEVQPSDDELVKKFTEWQALLAKGEHTKASALVTTQSETGLWRRRRRGRGFLGGIVHAVKKHVVNPWLQCKKRLINWSPTNRLHDKFLWGHCREKFQKKKERVEKNRIKFCVNADL